MSKRAYDRYLADEHYRHEVACVDCGYHRNGRHHPAIRCPRSGRCGDCGNDWPCEDHDTEKKNGADLDGRPRAQQTTTRT